MNQKKLNVLMLCKSLPWNFKGGIQTHTWDLSRELQERGHNISILCAGSLFKSQRFVKEGIEIIELPYLPGRYIFPFSKLAEELLFNLSLKFWVNKNAQKYDIVHMQGRSGYLLNQASGKTRYVQTIHGLLKDELQHSDNGKWGSKLYKLVSLPLERRQIALANKVLTVNEQLKNFISQEKIKPPKHIKVIPNGIKIGSPNKVASKTKKLVFVGRLTKIKNIEFLISLMTSLPWDITLSIIGEGPLKKKLEQEVQRRCLKLRVSFRGALSRREIDKELNNSMALILPSFHETQGIVLMEAASNSIPSIASNLPATRECVIDGETGFLCNVNDRSAFRRAILKLYNEPSKIKSMGRMARKHVMQKYDWSQLSEETAKVYAETLKK
ncbi:glycosyltransferase family 4 protein [Hyphobacterium sp. CCMP332]|nr:glycosyltransferase family 4 protein [Hyphobacterium sp. CCMP332]